ncbi:Fic/DOC family protein [Flavobacterium segetis]|uniref:Fic/DOC family protein n=2 Tax=Flavobacterium segetis TaxID=271157 RepID=A0A1M5IHN6_9FLAO|nr:Fic/DOC family protein [Flavobacterium segetis]
MDLVQLVIRYKALAIDEVINHEKFNHISIVHHSTKIEGSTLTEVETQVLLSDGLTPKGKPLQDSLMVTDHYTALLFTLQEAKIKRVVSTKLIQEINSIVVKNTARIYNTIFGTIDASIGAFRKGNVTAGSSYFPNFDKVADLTQKMTQAIQEQMQQPISILEQLHLSFVAHFNLVSIHPFYDGNGRTSRLLMNYIQAYYGLPLAIVYNESKAEYIEVLIATREQDDIEVFKAFMTTEYARMLTAEIQKFEDMKKPSKGRDFTLLF